MSFLYDKSRKKFADADIDLLVDTIRFGLVKSTYAQDQANHEFFSDLGANFMGTNGGATYADGKALGTKNTDAGVFDAADDVLTSVTTGSTCEALVIYKDGGSAGASPLIAYIDSGGFPITTNGNDVNVTWDSGSNKIFKL